MKITKNNGERSKMDRNEIMKGFNDYFILSLLMKGDSYGYEISKNLSLYTNAYYQIKESTMYTALQRLSNQRYISSYKGKETYGKERSYYKITAAGIEYYTELRKSIIEIIRCIDIFERRLVK